MHTRAEQSADASPRANRLRWVYGAVAAAPVAAALAALGALALAGPGAPWWLRALGSGLSVLCAAVMTAALAATLLLTALLWQVGRPLRRRRRSGEDGQVLIEFALAIPILLAVVLVMVQSALLMVGNLCLHYAAYCAARSAIVQVPLPLDNDEPHNVVLDAGDSNKIERVRRAAVWALMPISCGHRDQPADDHGLLLAGLEDLFDAYGEASPGWLNERIERKMYYADAYTEVSLALPDGWSGGGSSYQYGDTEDLTVTVYHTMYMSVPYAAWLFHVLDSRRGVELDIGRGEYGLEVEAQCTLTNEGVFDYVDKEQLR